MRRLLLGLGLLPCAALATVHYTLTPDPASKSIVVTVTIDAPKPTESFHIPAWSPGYYQIAQYQRKIYDVQASDGQGHTLTVDKLDSRGWSVQADGSPLTVTYRVHGDDPGLGFFAVNVAEDKAYLNGAAGFMYDDARKTEDVDLRIKNPAGWGIATAMDPDGAPDRFKAGGYDEFIDDPIQLGAFDRRTFEIRGIPFQVIFVSRRNKPNCDMDAETERLKVVSEPALKMFGGSSFKRYLYILHLEIGNFSGGLEHRACNVQAVANSPELHLDDLAAHEYFHAWNVKQIRPLILGPFDYTGPQRTANLWFCEGVTDYYAKLHTYQSGIQSEAWLRSQILDQIRELQVGRTRKQITVEAASRGCWESDGFGVGDLSYYSKGLIAGFIFDAAILDATDGKKNLDDVMRLLYRRHKLPNPGYGEDEIRTTINEVAGTDLSELYDRMIRSTAEMPYGLLAKIGLRATIDEAVTTDTRHAAPAGEAAAAYTLEVDPAADERAKMLYHKWLKRE